MRYFLKFVRLWDYTLLNIENFKLVPIIFKDKNLKNNTKLKC